MTRISDYFYPSNTIFPQCGGPSSERALQWYMNLLRHLENAKSDPTYPPFETKIPDEFSEDLVQVDIDAMIEKHYKDTSKRLRCAHMLEWASANKKINPRPLDDEKVPDWVKKNAQNYNTAYRMYKSILNPRPPKPLKVKPVLTPEQEQQLKETRRLQKNDRQRLGYQRRNTLQAKKKLALALRKITGQIAAPPPFTNDLAANTGFNPSLPPPPPSEALGKLLFRPPPTR